MVNELCTSTAAFACYASEIADLHELCFAHVVLVFEFFLVFEQALQTSFSEHNNNYALVLFSSLDML